MDSDRRTTLNLATLLAAIAILVTVVGVTWVAWDMAGPVRKSMLQGWDDSYYYFYLPSVVIDHDLDFANQIAQSGTMNADMRDASLSLPRTATGLIPNKYPPGWALGSLPFFLVAHALAPAGSTGFEPSYITAVWFGQLLYAVIGVWLAIKILSRYFPPETSTVIALVAWLASPLIYYQSARLAMSHSQVFALAMAMFWLSLQLLDGDKRLRSWWLLGFTSALLVITRNLAVVYCTLPLLVVLRRLRRVSAALALIGGAIGPLAVQLLTWKVLYGSWFAYSYGGERFNFSDLHLASVLFSPLHGWFYWHPLMFVGIGGFIAWAWPRPEGMAWIISLIAVVLLDAAWSTWWLGSSFGHRGFETATLFAMIGFASLWDAIRDRPKARQFLATVAALAVMWNLALFALFLTQRIPREKPVTYVDAANALRQWAGKR
jgi:hypothetical protein